MIPSRQTAIIDVGVGVLPASLQWIINAMDKNERSSQRVSCNLSSKILKEDLLGNQVHLGQLFQFLPITFCNSFGVYHFEMWASKVKIEV